MGWEPFLLGAALGAATLLVIVGLRTLMNRQLDDAARGRGYWPLNGGLVLAGVSMYLMIRLTGA